jgi:hypothetical protein
MKRNNYRYLPHLDDPTPDEERAVFKREGFIGDDLPSFPDLCPYAYETLRQEYRDWIRGDVTLDEYSLTLRVVYIYDPSNPAEFATSLATVKSEDLDTDDPDDSEQERIQALEILDACRR